MSGDGIIRYLSRETRQYSSHRHNYDEIYEEESLDVYFGDERRVNRSLRTSHSSSCNNRGYSISDVGRSGSMSQYTSHCSSLNHGTGVDIEGRGGYRSHTSHYYPHNPIDRGILLTSPVSSHCVDQNVH